MTTAGVCLCGCGQPTNTVTSTSKRRGVKQGDPCKYVFGHRRKHAPPTKDDIHSRVQVDPVTECWNWRGTVQTETGYGRLGGHTPGVHRLSYRLFVGEIPEGIQVLHDCDNRLCCNPKHLFLGTIADNMVDKHQKGRCAKGVSHGSVKLTEQDVRTIRASSDTTLALSKVYPVSRMQIDRIRARVSWSHLM